MALKLITVFLFFLVCQVCLSARITREAKKNELELNEKQKAELDQILLNLKSAKTPLEKAYAASAIVRLTIEVSFNTTESKEDDSSEETFDEFKVEFNKIFTEDEKAEYNKLVGIIETAETTEERADAIGELTALTFKAAFVSWAAEGLEDSVESVPETSTPKELQGKPKERKNFVESLTEKQKTEFEQLLSHIKSSKTPIEKAYAASDMVKFAIRTSFNVTLQESAESDSSEETLQTFENEFNDTLDEAGRTEFHKLVATLESSKTTREQSDALEELVSFTIESALKKLASSEESGEKTNHL